MSDLVGNPEDRFSQNEAQIHTLSILLSNLLLYLVGLMEVLYRWVTQERQQLPLHLIRFIAHLALFLRTSEYNTKVRCNKQEILLNSAVKHDFILKSMSNISK